MLRVNREMGFARVGVNTEWQKLEPDPSPARRPAPIPWSSCITVSPACGARPRRSARRRRRSRAPRRRARAPGRAGRRPAPVSLLGDPVHSRHSPERAGDDHGAGATPAMRPPARTCTRSQRSHRQTVRAHLGRIRRHRLVDVAASTCPATPARRARRSSQPAISAPGGGGVAQPVGPRVERRRPVGDGDVAGRTTSPTRAWADESRPREPRLDVAVEQAADRVVPHELRPRAGHGRHGLGEIRPPSEDGRWSAAARQAMRDRCRATRVTP